MTLMWDGDTQGVGEEHHMDTEGEDRREKKKKKTTLVIYGSEGFFVTFTIEL